MTKTFKRLLLAVLIACLTLCVGIFATACKTPDNGDDKEPPINQGGNEEDDDNNNGDGDNEGAVTITLDKETLILSVDNDEDQITATVSNGADVEWTSENDSIVMVGDNGAVQAFKPGAVTITATVKDTDISATCEVLVEDAYYIIGGEDSTWTPCGTFGAGAVYFHATETEGVYKTTTELTSKSNFQIAVVGNTGSNWWQTAYGQSHISTEEGNALSVINGNIGVEKHGVYTITLDLSGETATVYGVCDREIDDGDVEYVYYLIGSHNNWQQYNTVEDADSRFVFTKGEDGKYTLTVEFEKGVEFKIVVVGQAYKIEYANHAPVSGTIGNGPATADGAFQLVYTTSSNIGIGVAGEYAFTFDPDAETDNQLSYVFTKTAASDVELVLEYYAKGSFDGASWPSIQDDAHRFTEEDGTYTLTLELTAGNELLFYGMYKNPDTGALSDANIYVKYGALDSASQAYFTNSGDNLKANATGSYTFTYTDGVLSVTFVAAAE